MGKCLLLWGRRGHLENNVFNFFCRDYLERGKALVKISVVARLLSRSCLVAFSLKDVSISALNILSFF